MLRMSSLHLALCCLLAGVALACSSSDDGAATTGSGAGAGASSTSTASSGGQGGGGVGPPFEIGPKQYGSYLAFDTQGATGCSVTMSFVYYQPTAPGPFPIFVFTKGTRGEWDNDSLIHDEMLTRMAARGFVAVSPDYQSNVDIFPGPFALSCVGFHEKAKCIFAPNATHPDSVIATLERDSHADSTLGVVTSGISQGGLVALVARDHNDAVRGSNPLSIGTHCGTMLDLTGCTLPSSIAIDSERVRIVNGESDATFGGMSSPQCDGMQQVDPVWYREQLNLMAAQSCSTAASSYECLRPNGSGWILARDDQVAGGVAHHAFPYANYPIDPDPNWASTADAWGREANQAWLAGLLQ